MKNAMLAMIGGLLFLTIVQSCKKDGGGPTTPAPTISGITGSPARTGDIVTITGTNFTGATVVNFGGTAATSFTVVNATTITAVVVTGAALCLLSVFTPSKVQWAITPEDSTSSELL